MQVGQPVREDEVIAQIETDKVTIDIKSPTSGVLQQLLVKPSDLVVAGQVVAVVGAAEIAATAAPTAVAASQANAADSTSESTSGRKPSIHFPPRITASGMRISELPEAEHIMESVAAELVAGPSAIHTVAAESAVQPVLAAVPHPMPAAKAAPPPFSKNKLQYITRPDGRGRPPRRPLTERELEMINLGGVS